MKLKNVRVFFAMVFIFPSNAMEFEIWNEVTQEIYNSKKKIIFEEIKIARNVKKAINSARRLQSNEFHCPEWNAKIDSQETTQEIIDHLLKCFPKIERPELAAAALDTPGAKKWLEDKDKDWFAVIQMHPEMITENEEILRIALLNSDIFNFVNKNLKHNNPLMRAVRKGNLRSARRLLRTGLDANMENRYGHPLLYVATKKANYAMVKLLLKYGAQPDGIVHRYKDAPEELAHEVLFSALIHAAATGNYRITKKLIEKGANPSIKNFFEDTPLAVTRIEYEALSKRVEDYEKVITLLEQKEREHLREQIYKAFDSE